MACPPTIAEAVQSILAQGLLRIRAAAWAGDALRCAWEADHLHNLPALLTQYSPEKLAYYWQVERPEFLRRAAAAGLGVQEFEPGWKLMGGQCEAAA
jgi:hypothetical protein